MFTLKLCAPLSESNARSPVICKWKSVRVPFGPQRNLFECVPWLGLWRQRRPISSCPHYWSRFEQAKHFEREIPLGKKSCFYQHRSQEKESLSSWFMFFCWTDVLNCICWNFFFKWNVFLFFWKSIFRERIWSKFIVEISIPDAGVSSQTCTMVHFCHAGSPRRRRWLRSCWQPSQRSHSLRLTHQADHGNAPSTAGNAYVNLWTILYPPFTASLPRSPWRQHPALRPDNRIQQLNSVFLTLSLIAHSLLGWRMMILTNSHYLMYFSLKDWDNVLGSERVNRSLPS